MTVKNHQNSKIWGHFCKMCTYDSLTPSSATPGEKYKFILPINLRYLLAAQLDHFEDEDRFFLEMDWAGGSTFLGKWYEDMPWS